MLCNTSSFRLPSPLLSYWHDNTTFSDYAIDFSGADVIIALLSLSLSSILTVSCFQVLVSPPPRPSIDRLTIPSSPSLRHSLDSSRIRFPTTPLSVSLLPETIVNNGQDFPYLHPPKALRRPPQYAQRRMGRLRIESSGQPPTDQGHL